LFTPLSRDSTIYSSFQQLQIELQAALDSRRLENEDRLLQQEASNRTSFCDLIGGSDQGGQRFARFNTGQS